MSIDKVAKAITSALVVGYGIYAFATSVESAGGEGVTSAEWVRVAVYTVLAFVAVWAVPNDTTPTKPATPTEDSE